MVSMLARDHGFMLRSEQDALDVLSSGLPSCIFHPGDLHPEFFDFANGIAGAVMQKFVNYRFRVALIVPGDHGYGDRVTELIRDHRTHPCIRFFDTVEAAQAWLAE